MPKIEALSVLIQRNTKQVGVSGFLNWNWWLFIRIRGWLKHTGDTEMFSILSIYGFVLKTICVQRNACKSYVKLCITGDGNLWRDDRIFKRNLCSNKIQLILSQRYKATCKRTQQLPTLLAWQSWDLLRACWQLSANGRQNSQQRYNATCKRTQQLPTLLAQ